MGSTPRLLDLFCGEGGAGDGYARAGFDVTGVDIRNQTRYPHRFIRADAWQYVADHGREYDVIHASPPCRAHSRMSLMTQRTYFAFVTKTRELLIAVGRPYVIENVEGAPLVRPVLLCGSMFGMRTYRHRLFESSIALSSPPHPVHVAPPCEIGRNPRPNEYYTFIGHFPDIGAARRVMDMPWASRDGIADAVPPEYTRYLGTQIMMYLAAESGVAA